MIDIFIRGGFFIWPILISSIFALAITIERLLFFRRISFDEKAVLRKIKLELKANRKKQAFRLAHEAKGPIADMMVKSLYLRDAPCTAQDKEKIITQAGSNQIRKLEKHLRTLGIIAHVAPLLGLLGTVTGMINAFMKIEELAGQVDASVLAGGIWEALLTTAVGLSVAVPAMVAYHYFEGQVDEFYSRIKNTVLELLGLNVTDDDEHYAVSPYPEEDIDYGV